MKNLIRTTTGIFSIFLIILACTKEVELKTEVEFSVTEQHEASGYIDESLSTTITVVPEEILEEFSYSYSYSVSKGSGHFQDRSGKIFPQDERIALNPLSATVMYVGSEAGENTVKVIASDNYGFTQEVEIAYTLAEVPPVVWTATSTVKRIELGNSAQITVNFEKSKANTDVNYERRYRITAGSGELTELSGGTEGGLTEFHPILPGTYMLNFKPEELGIMELSFDLKGDDGETFKAELSFEVLEEIIDTVIPEITLLGENTITVQTGSNYKDPGAKAIDDVDGDISGAIVVDASKVDMTQVGTYKVTYNVSDSSGNAAITVIRTVEVIAGDNPLSPENGILAFAIPGQKETADIDEIAHTVTVNVPSGTETKVAPIALSVSPDASVSPSPSEVQDFEKTVTYIVTAENGTKKEWRVTINVAASEDKSIENFTIMGVAGNISGTDISVTLPAGNDASSLTPVVQFMGASLSPQSDAVVDFTNAVTYTVTAEDGSTQEYMVTVIIEKSAENDITGFEIAGVAGVFSGTNITVTLPAGNDEKSLSPTLVHTGVSISPASGSAIDFTDPVTFAVTAENGTQKTYSAFVIVTNDRPTANAIASSTRVSLNEDINFTGNTSTDDINIVSYAWDFGDGNSSTLADPVHSYAVHGTYTITLKVTDDGGLTNTVSLLVEVPNVAPTARASASTTTADTGETINFTGSSSSDDAGIATYLWEFGDGNTSSAVNPMHSYAVEGPYPVKLTVTDNQGLNHTANLNIIVNTPNREPIAVASSDITSGPNILTVNFNGAGSRDPDGDSMTYNWDFGDGATSSQTNPSHDFDVAGEYTVVLSVSDGRETVTDNIQITVLPLNIETGRYSAPAGSGVSVSLIFGGPNESDEGISYLSVDGGKNKSGINYLDLDTDEIIDRTDSGSFTMPSSGVVYFKGRHDGGASSGTYSDVTINGPGVFYDYEDRLNVIGANQ